MDGNRQAALASLIQLSQKQGYILFDDIMNSADEYAFSIQDVDWLSNAIATRGILVYDETPLTNAGNNSDDDYDDFAQTDYESIFNRVIELSPSLKPFIEDIRNVIPPQYKEMSQLKYQVLEGNQHARQRMIEMHLRVAVRIALQRTEAFDLDIEETLGNACIGLINAVDKYDPDTCGPFSSYASFWIYQNMTREQGTRRPLVYYPVHRKEWFYTMFPILKSHGCFECDEWIGCQKVNEMICEKLQCTPEQAEDVISACTPIESLDMFLENMDVCEKQAKSEKHDGDNDGNEQLFLYSENMYENIERKTLQQLVRDMLGELKQRERNHMCTIRIRGWQ